MTKEEFFREMESKIKETKEINEKLIELSAQGKLWENDEYSLLRKRQWELHDVVGWYQKLIDKTTSYDEFIRAYNKFLVYSKEHNLEEIPFINDRVSFLDKHFKKDESFSVDFNYFPPIICDIENGFDKLDSDERKKDLTKVLDYFKRKREKDLYKWELEYITFLLYYDQVCHSPFSVTFFGDYGSLKRTKECDEYVSNFNKLIQGLDNNEFSFNLLLWTVFKTYHYLYKQNSEFVVNKSDLVLIDKLLILSRKVFPGDFEQRIIKENTSLDNEEKSFIFNLSQLLCLDLLHTIYNGFPDYYDTCIMFLGYGLYIPAGCSDLDTSMKSFESFVKGITNYDFWLELDGPKVFEKMNINYDYEKVLKNI